MRNTMNNKGFTLVEIVIALGVLGIGILAMFSMLTISIKGNSAANRITNELVQGADIIEQLMSRDYDNDDFDGDGTVDANDGDIDNDGSNGLNDADCCQDGNDPAGNVADPATAKADFCYLQDDSFVYVNVAPDYPANNMKTVQIIVQKRSGSSPPMVLTTVKTEL